MEAILARRFASFNFSVIVGFPNDVPTIDIWGDCLPRFREKDEDNLTLHLIKFHQCMDRMNIYHEDALMKMFMYSLEGDAHVWYRSLPASNISYLREFHVAFNEQCKRYFPAELLLVDCCEQCKLGYYSQEVVLNTYEEEYEEALNVSIVSNVDKGKPIYDEYPDKVQ